LPIGSFPQRNEREQYHRTRDIDTLEFRVLWDADQLVNLQEDSADPREPAAKTDD
jgi:hypothetical protein